jgi:hypothetical protein
VGELNLLPMWRFVHAKNGAWSLAMWRMQIALMLEYQKSVNLHTPHHLAHMVIRYP